MSKRVKGLLVEIGGEITGLDKALGDVSTKSNKLQKELSDVNRLLKFNPDDTELLAQKQKLLGDSIQNTREKLEVLKNAQEEVNQKFKDGEISEEQYRAFQREIVETESKLRNFEKQLKETGESTKALGERLQEAGDKAKKIGNDMKGVGSSLTRNVSVPLAAVGAASFKLGKDFEKSMSQIVGLVGVAQEEVNVWAEEILKMGPALGKAPGELADALFFVTSAGIRGAEAMKVLEMSAKASAAGLGETKTIADLITSAMNAYGIENLNASKATDILVAAVREGKAEASSLAASMGEVLPIAAEMGVSFDQVAAAQAAMTRTGTSASQSSTQLKAILSSILKPTQEAEKALSGMGISSSELRKQIQDEGLISTLGRLRELTNQYGEDTMARVFPNISALTGVLDLMGSNAASNIAVFDALGNSTGSLDKAFESAAETAEFEWQRSMAAVQAASIELWQDMKENVIPIMKGVTDSIQSVARWFRNLDPEQRQAIIKFGLLSTALGPVLVGLGTIIATGGIVVGAMGKMTVALGLKRAAFKAATTEVGLFNAALRAISPAALIGKVAVAAVGVAIAGLTKDLVTNEKQWYASKRAMDNFSGTASDLKSQVLGVSVAQQNASSANLQMINEMEAMRLRGTEAVRAQKEMAVSVEEVATEMDIASEAAAGLANAQKDASQELIQDMDRLGTAVVQALRNRYEEEERLQTDSLQKQKDAVRETADANIAEYDREYVEKLKIIDEEAYAKIKALEDEINRIDKVTKAEEKILKEQEHRKRRAEYEKQLAAAESAEEQQRIQQQLSDYLARYERDQLLASRREKQQSIRDEITNIRTATQEKKDLLKEEYDNLKASEEEKALLKLEALSDEMNAVQEHYKELLREENIQAAARKQILSSSQEEIVQLLNSYNPRWQEAGRSLGQNLLDGIQSMTPSIESEIDRILRQIESAQRAAGSSGGHNSYNVGIPRVPYDQLAYIHKNEMVVPADQNPNNPNATNPTTGSGTNQTIIINSPTPLSASEIARKSKQASRELALEFTR